MEAFLAAATPRDPARVALLAGLLPLTLGLGLLLMRRAATHPQASRWGAWLWCLGAAGVVLAGSRGEPGAIRMLLLIGVVLYAMKSVVAVEVVRAGAAPLPTRAWWAWAALWPGMAPELFRSLGNGTPALPSERTEPVRAFLLRGSGWLALGLALMAGARGLYEAGLGLGLTTALALPGISLVLHFGLFSLLCAVWRAAGVPVYSLFPAPLLSRSLAEFWGRRWNLPFTEMIQRAVYRPLTPVLGRPTAALAGFAFSGLLHECAISLPVNAGIGLPALYFALHGGLVVAERRTALGGWLQRHPVAARVWTLGWLAAPMPILFHRAFLSAVVWPLLGIRA